VQPDYDAEMNKVSSQCWEKKEKMVVGSKSSKNNDILPK
jgi:hypothetical protein